MSSGLCSPTQARLPQVHDAVESLGNLVGAVHDNLSGLEARLECVTQPKGPTVAEESKPAHNVPLVNSLSGLCQALRAANDRIGHLRDRLEV